jgi:vacuolar protein sorting-associated protein 13A/C
LFFNAELPGGDSIVMITTSRVIAFSPTRLRVKWDIPFKHIERVVISDNGIKFADKAGKEYDKFVTIADPKAKSWFFQEIEKQVVSVRYSGFRANSVLFHQSNQSMEC